MTTKRNLSLAMGLLLASTALHAQEVVNRGIDMSVVTGGVSVPTGTATGVQRNVKFGDRSYQIPENFEIGSYYATWGIYGGRDYWPADVPVERLSEVYLAFGAICGRNPGAFNSGECPSSKMPTGGNGTMNIGPKTMCPALQMCGSP
jgi:GH18 family chitinase